MNNPLFDEDSGLMNMWGALAAFLLIPTIVWGAIIYETFFKGL